MGNYKSRPSLTCTGMALFALVSGVCVLDSGASGRVGSAGGCDHRVAQPVSLKPLIISPANHD